MQRSFYLFLFAILAASGASGQPLAIERVEAPASVASGDAVEIRLNVRVRNPSDSNKRYALAAIVEGAEQARWASSSALRPGATERVALTWTQAARGSSVRGHVALLNTRGMEIERESFEITVSGGRPAAPVVSVPTPPIEPRRIPGIPRPSLPGGTPGSGGLEARPINPDVTPAPYVSRDIGFTATPLFVQNRDGSPRPFSSYRGICDVHFQLRRGVVYPRIDFWIVNEGTEVSELRTQASIDVYRRAGRPDEFEQVGVRFNNFGLISERDPLTPGAYRERGGLFSIELSPDDFRRNDEFLVAAEMTRSDDNTRNDRLVIRGIIRGLNYNEDGYNSEVLDCKVEDSTTPLGSPSR